MHTPRRYVPGSTKWVFQLAKPKAVAARPCRLLDEDASEAANQAAAAGCSYATGGWIALRGGQACGVLQDSLPLEGALSDDEGVETSMCWIKVAAAFRGGPAIAPTGHLGCAMTLAELGTSLRTRFEQTGNAADLDAAIAAGQEAVDLTPPGHPDYPRYLSGLGICLVRQF